MAEMTESKLRDLCKKHDLFLTPSANEKLYAHYSGFRAISGMDKYTGLKTLFLEGNGLDSLTGLPHLPHLKCLYAHGNGMYNLEGLESAPALETLSVDQNFLETLEGLEATPGLGTLLAADNRFETVQDVSPLRGCLRLTTLDLRNNRISSEEGLLQLLQTLPALRCLYLRGNEFVSKMRNYRKTLITALPELTYLDDRPIFEMERRAAMAWQRGGLEEERAERLRVQQQEAARTRGNFEEMQNIRRQCWRKRRASLGLAPGDADPFFEINKAPSSDGDSPDQDAEAATDILPCRKCTYEVCCCKQQADEDGEEQPPLQPQLPLREEAQFQELLQDDPVHQANEQESAAQLASILDQDQWANMQAAPPQQPRHWATKDIDMQATLSKARSAAIKRKLHADVSPHEDSTAASTASQQPEGPHMPTAQQQPVAAVAHPIADELQPAPTAAKPTAQEVSPQAAATLAEALPSVVPAAGPSAAAIAPKAASQKPFLGSATGASPDLEPVVRDGFILDKRPVDTPKAPAPQAPPATAAAAPHTATTPPVCAPGNIAAAAAEAAVSADAEEPLPQPKAPTGRMQRASQWQDNDTYETEGAEEEDIQHLGVVMETDEGARAAEAASADAAPHSSQSTISVERQKNLEASQQLLSDLGTASLAMRATQSRFV